MPSLPVGGDTLASDVLWPLLGLETVSDGATNVIADLNGDSGWLGLGLAFTASNQTVNYSIDVFTPGANGVEALQEADYGVVAAQGIGLCGQRSVVMSYALRELVDGDEPNTRAELLSRIHTFLTADSLSLPAVDSLRISVCAGADSIRLSWNYPFAVDTFNVYEDEDPHGSFSTLSGQTSQPEFFLSASAWQRRFYRVYARKFTNRL